MPAEQAFERLTAFFTPPLLAQLLSERRVELACAAISGAAPLLTGEGLLGALYAGEVPAGSVRFYVNRQKFDFQAIGMIETEQVPAEIVHKLIRQGATLVFDHLEQAFAPLARFARLIGESLQRGVQISGVLSFTDRSGIAPHHDTENVFILQLEGEKEWVLLGDPVAEGLPNSGYAEPEGEPRSLTLRAGDAMFVPAGQRHYCNPSPAGSLHLGVLLEAGEHPE